MTFNFRQLFLLKSLLAIVACGWVASATAAERPNILFIFSDDHAPHAIGAYNGWLKEVNPTPNIDKLAGQGMLFEN
ncbi:MAG: acetylglucosamine-6-sulfatase, partial [Planctomycetales bacterium]